MIPLPHMMLFSCAYIRMLPADRVTVRQDLLFGSL